ncbi:MAG: methyltransferase domain-containing protein [Patescibacteria group bacterium]
MHKYFFILGRSPKLSRVEIESILPTLPGEYGIPELIDDVLFLDFKIFGDNKFQMKDLMDRLGGTVKIGKIIDEVEDHKQIFKTLTVDRIIDKYLPQTDQKITFGFSLYKTGGTYSNSFEKDVTRNGIQIKMGLKRKGHNARFVTAKDKTLSSVIVGENKLIERGADICIFFEKGKIFIGKTIAVQDYKSFGKFDYGRPSADPRSGMLPPKVARIMVNLSQMKPDGVLLDPFCGSGTILQEALLLGIKKVIGSDISPRAISDTTNNLKWLTSELNLSEKNYQVFQSDIRNLTKILKTKVDAIVAEPFLGPPLRGSESVTQLQENIKELSKLYIESFRNFQNIIKEDGKIVIIFPVMKKDNKEYYLPILEEISKLGFIIKKYADASSRGGYLYSRPDQKVMREIFVFERINR